MKWLLVCLAVFFMVSPAIAGEDPYFAIVGNDCAPGTTDPLGRSVCPVIAPVTVPVAGVNEVNLTDVLPAALQQFLFTSFVGAKNPWYVSPKHEQFYVDQRICGIPICDPANATLLPTYSNMTNRFPQSAPAGCEQFRAQNPINQPEICFVSTLFPAPITVPFTTIMPGNLNSVVRAGNAGFFEWFVRLPKKPSGEINLIFECGVLKPNSFAFNGFESVEVCAAETGERVGPNCTRIEVDPGVSPVIAGALPRVTAIAYPGPFNSFTPFHLTAFRNPGSYTIAFDAVTGAMSNNAAAQVLDGSTNARILLKSCMDKTVITKLPVTGQLNAFTPAETETDLEFGDLIYVRLDVPRANSVDIYCNPQSLRVAGVGESCF